MKPNSIGDWNTILNAIGWIQDNWEEMQKASADMEMFGSGYLRITSQGVKHVPLKGIVLLGPGLVNEFQQAALSNDKVGV